jgi:TonB family protein
MRLLVMAIVSCLPLVAAADIERRIDPDPQDPVGRAMKAKIKDFRVCFKLEAERNPKLKNGKVVLAVELDKAGAVTVARVKSSTLGAKRVEDCLVAAMKTMTFPAEAPRAFDFPFEFAKQ